VHVRVSTREQVVVFALVCARRAREAGMIFRSPYPDVSIPELPLTPYLLQHTGRLTNKPALIDGATGSTYSYGQLAAAVRHLGANLARRGLTPRAASSPSTVPIVPST
jgi:non-ribosomal peptide synthetase component E (peptide arylation enzyme)